MSPANPPRQHGELTDARDALDGDLPHALLEAGQARVDLADLCLLPLNQLLDDLQWESGTSARTAGHEAPTDPEQQPGAALPQMTLQ